MQQAVENGLSKTFLTAMAKPKKRPKSLSTDSLKRFSPTRVNTNFRRGIRLHYRTMNTILNVYGFIFCLSTLIISPQATSYHFEVHTHQQNRQWTVPMANAESVSQPRSVVVRFFLHLHPLQMTRPIARSIKGTNKSPRRQSQKIQSKSLIRIPLKDRIGTPPHYVAWTRRMPTRAFQQTPRQIC